jgi:hypothetical protein
MYGEGWLWRRFSGLHYRRVSSRFGVVRAHRGTWASDAATDLKLAALYQPPRKIQEIKEPATMKIFVAGKN